MPNAQTAPAGENDNRRPWEQQPNEGPSAYAAFVAYRDLGHHRTINAAWRVLRPISSQAENAPGRWRVWVRQWDWTGRAAAWDREIDRQATTGRVAATVAAATTGVQESERRTWRGQIPLEEVESAKKLIQRGREELDAPAAVKPNKSAAVAMIELGHKLYRIAAQMPIRIEPEEGGDFRDMFYATSGQLEAALPAGAAPPMPADPTRPPPQTSTPLAAAAAGVPVQPNRLRP